MALPIRFLYIYFGSNANFYMYWYLMAANPKPEQDSLKWIAQYSTVANYCWPSQHNYSWPEVPLGLLAVFLFVPRPCVCLEMGD
jgi:hypothetical protein